MKRVKKLVTLVAIAAISFGSVMSVFADETAPAAATSAVAYNNLAYTEKAWYFDDKDCGSYPVITGMDSLNAKIEDCIWKASLRSDRDIKFKLAYTVEDTDRYAAILLAFDYEYATMFKGSDAEAFWFFVDKETMTEVTEDEYLSLAAEPVEAPVAPIAEASEEASATSEASEAGAASAEAEVKMVGVREYAENLGLSVEWNDALKAVTIVIDGEILATFKVDVNEYTFDGEAVELESAPINQDGTVYVPASFFECLGAEVSYAADGSVKSIAFPEEVAQAIAESAAAGEDAADDEVADGEADAVADDEAEAEADYEAEAEAEAEAE